MNTIEGDYDEIVKGMRVHGVQYATNFGHGRIDDDERSTANVGLFSLNEDHRDDCLFCINGGRGGRSMETSFDRTCVFFGEWREEIEIEDPEHSHLLRF